MSIFVVLLVTLWPEFLCETNNIQQMLMASYLLPWGLEEVIINWDLEWNSLGMWLFLKIFIQNMQKESHMNVVSVENERK